LEFKTMASLNAAGISGNNPSSSESAARLQARVEAMIERELERCQRSMPPEEWAEQRQWVTANVVEAARQWMRARAAEGTL
jgi:hypothetical protein